MGKVPLVPLDPQVPPESEAPQGLLEALDCRAGGVHRVPPVPLARRAPRVSEVPWVRPGMMGSRVPWGCRAQADPQAPPEKMGTRARWGFPDRRAAKATRARWAPPDQQESRDPLGTLAPRERMGSQGAAGSRGCLGRKEMRDRGVTLA